MQWNTGRSYKLDRARHNKSEEYEVPVNKRKRRFKSGGTLVDDKKAMVLSQIKEVHHHADELAKVLANMDTVDAWVVGKMERATTDLSDITHYLDGTTEYAKGGMMGKHFVGKFNESQLRSGEDKKAIQKAMKETGYKYIDNNIIYKNGKPHMMEVYLYADGGMMADGGITKEKYIVSFNYNPSNLKNSDAEKIVSKYTNNWSHDNDFDEVSFYVIGLSKENAEELVAELKMEDAYNIEIDKSRYAYGGMMAKGGEVKSKTKKYQILSPDGITIEREVPYYTSKNKAMNAFDKWKENYSRQGYYSSVRYGRIDLSDLADYCQFITL